MPIVGKWSERPIDTGVKAAGLGFPNWFSDNSRQKITIVFSRTDKGRSDTHMDNTEYGASPKRKRSFGKGAVRWVFRLGVLNDLLEAVLPRGECVFFTDFKQNVAIALDKIGMSLFR